MRREEHVQIIDACHVKILVVLLTHGKKLFVRLDWQRLASGNRAC